MNFEKLIISQIALLIFILSFSTRCFSENETQDINADQTQQQQAQQKEETFLQKYKGPIFAASSIAALLVASAIIYEFRKEEKENRTIFEKNKSGEKEKSEKNEKVNLTDLVPQNVKAEWVEEIRSYRFIDLDTGRVYSNEEWVDKYFYTNKREEAFAIKQKAIKEYEALGEAKEEEERARVNAEMAKQKEQGKKEAAERHKKAAEEILRKDMPEISAEGKAEFVKRYLRLVCEFRSGNLNLGDLAFSLYRLEEEIKRRFSAATIGTEFEDVFNEFNNLLNQQNIKMQVREKINNSIKDYDRTSDQIDKEFDAMLNNGDEKLKRLADACRRGVSKEEIDKIKKDLGSE
jgi:hypothetical protein